MNQVITGDMETDVRAKLSARIAELEAKLVIANKPKAVTLKVSEKGAVSMYGLGRFPVTLYAGQWDRLLTQVDAVRAFIAANSALLSVKP